VVCEFLTWCEDRGEPSITVVRSVHVACYMEELTREQSAPTAKRRLAAIRSLFRWLVIGQVLPLNPYSRLRECASAIPSQADWNGCGGRI